MSIKDVLETVREKEHGKLRIILLLTQVKVGAVQVAVCNQRFMNNTRSSVNSNQEFFIERD